MDRDSEPPPAGALPPQADSDAEPGELSGSPDSPHHEPLRVELTDLQDAFDPTALRLEEIARVVLADEGVTEADLSLVLVGHAQMRELNRTHLAHDYETDVLSFLLDESGDPEAGDYLIEGEVILSTEMARDTAARLPSRTDGTSWTAADELRLYLVHGVLHLVGHDDHADNDRERMRSREREHLAKFGPVPIYEDHPTTSQAGAPQPTDSTRGGAT